MAPEDYKELLSLTNGVHDPDYRGAHVAAFNGVKWDFSGVQIVDELIPLVG